MSKETKYIALRDFTFSQAGERVEVVEGDVCPDVGPGRLPSLLRNGWIVPADEYAPQPPAAEEGGDEGGGEPADWRQTAIADLEVEAKIRAALAKADFTTVGALVAYGAEHGKLTGIEGIGESSEKALQEAIAKLSQ